MKQLYLGLSVCLSVCLYVCLYVFTEMESGQRGCSCRLKYCKHQKQYKFMANKKNGRFLWNGNTIVYLYKQETIG